MVNVNPVYQSPARKNSDPAADISIFLLLSLL